MEKTKSDANVIALKILLDDVKLITLKVTADTTLATLRELIQQRQIQLEENHLFLDETGFPIGLRDEIDYKVQEIAQDSNIVKMGTQPERSKKPLPDLPSLPQFPANDITIPILPNVELRAAQIPGNMPIPSANDRLCDALNFNPLQWQTIFERCNLFHGLDMNNEEPTVSRYPACQFKNNNTKPQFNIRDGSFIEAYLAKSERHNSLIRNKLIKVDPNFKCPFVSLAAGYGGERQKIENKQSKTLYTTCTWNFPRITLHLFDENIPKQQYLTATRDFERAVESIVNLRFVHGGSNSNEALYAHLQEVFKTYGQVFPSSVTLGGQLFYTDIQHVQANLDENKHRDKIFGQFRGLKGQIEGGCGGGQEAIEINRNETVHHLSLTKLEATGGNTLLAHNIGEWTSTVGNSFHWRVIQYGELIPTYKLLNYHLQSGVDRILYFHNAKEEDMQRQKDEEVQREFFSQERERNNAGVVDTFLGLLHKIL